MAKRWAIEGGVVSAHGEHVAHHRRTTKSLLRLRSATRLAAWQACKTVTAGALGDRGLHCRRTSTTPLCMMKRLLAAALAPWTSP